MRVIYLHGFASGPTSSKAKFFQAKFSEAGIPVSIPSLDGGDFRNLTVTSQLSVIHKEASSIPDSEPVLLMGSSLGGYLASLYAARHQRVAGVILMAPAFCFASRWSESNTPEMIEWRKQGVMEMFHYGDKVQRKIGYGLIEDGLQYENYPDVRQPALVLHGALDPVVPVSLSEEFARRHGRNAKLVVYQQSGHELTNVVEDMWTEITGWIPGLG